MTAELMKRNARDATGSSCGQRTTQGACVVNRAVQDCGRRLNQSHFRPMAEVSFLPSANTRKSASASREGKSSLSKLKSLFPVFSRQFFQLVSVLLFSLNDQKVKEETSHSLTVQLTHNASTVFTMKRNYHFTLR